MANNSESLEEQTSDSISEDAVYTEPMDQESQGDNTAKDTHSGGRVEYETPLDGEDSDETIFVPGDEDPHDAALHEEILSSDNVFNGLIFNVERTHVRLPSGVPADRDIIRHPGAAAIVALTDTGKIAMVRQYRTPLDRVTVEIPAGKLDLGEDPLDCARRELKEETGFTAGRIAYLTTIATTPGFCDEMIHIFLATHLEFEGAHPDDDEFLNVELVPVRELVDAVLDGKIEDAKTVVGALACEVMAHRLAED